MNRGTKLFLTAVFAAAALSAATVTASAEGSVNLVGSYDESSVFSYYSQNSYRPYLEWSAVTNVEQERTSIIYVYAKEGETIYFGSSDNAQDMSSIQAIWGYDTNTKAYTYTENKFNDSTSLYGGNNAVGIAVTIPAEDGGMPFDPETANEESPSYTVVSDGTTTINDHSTVYLFRVDKKSGGTGYISSPEQEKNGPDVNNGNNDGYKPLSFRAPTTGTYAFRFLSANHSQNTDPSPKKVSEQWALSNNNAVAAFDVTVYNNNNEKQSGRVWSDMLFLNAGNQHLSIYSQVYVLTDDGFEYRVDLNGIEPAGFVLYSNNRGFLWDPNNLYTTNGDEYKYNLQSLNHSFYSKSTGTGNNVGDLPVVNGGSTYINLIPTVDGVDKSHKIFFSKADDEALGAYTLTKKLVTTDDIDVVDDTYTNTISYKGNGPYTLGQNDTSLGGGTEGFGGTFTVNAKIDPEKTAPDQMAVELDFSEYELNDEGQIVKNSDGSWKKLSPANSDSGLETANTRILLGSKSNTNSDGTYTYTMVWNGLDAYGNVVPAGDYNSIISVYSANGVIHLPLIDVESNKNGIKIESLNDIDYTTLQNKDKIDKDKDKWTVYYNNYPSSQYIVSDSTGINLGDNVNNTNGVSSENGAMKYNSSSNSSAQTNGAGDNTALDVWADCYIKITSGETITVLDHPQVKATVSFVGEQGTENLAGSGYAGSHDTYYKDPDDALVYNNESVSEPGTGLQVDQSNGKKGGDDYGNTIATSFTTRIVNKGSESWNNLYWTITLPDPAESPVYVKKSNSEKDIPLNKVYSFEDDNSTNNPVLTDSTTVNDSYEGTIYKATGFVDTNASGSGKIVFTVFDDISTTITTDGEIIYGLVIDNIYAPGALASVTYESSAGSTVNVTNDQHSESYNDYLASQEQPSGSESE